MECDPATFNKLVKKDFLYIGWRRCGFRESFHVKKCYKCLKYGHLAKDCRFSIVCSNCAGNHSYNNCNSDEKKCINCVDYNLKFKAKLSINHSSFDANCECYKKSIANFKAITCYDPAA